MLARSVTARSLDEYALQGVGRDRDMGKRYKGWAFTFSGYFRLCIIDTVILILSIII